MCSHVIQIYFSFQWKLLIRSNSTPFSSSSPSFIAAVKMSRSRHFIPNYQKWCKTFSNPFNLISLIFKQRHSAVFRLKQITQGSTLTQSFSSFIWKTCKRIKNCKTFRRQNIKNETGKYLGIRVERHHADIKTLKNPSFSLQRTKNMK